MDLPRKILLTTSRNPTPRIRTFCHDFAKVLPSISYVNRGKMSNDDVAEKVVEYDADRVVIVDRWHGGLGVLRFFLVTESGLTEASPTIHFAAKLQRELGVSNVKPAVSMRVQVSNKSDELASLAASLSGFFGLPISLEEQEHKPALTMMRISWDKSGKIEVTFMDEPRHVELGPRITVSKLEW